MATWPPEYDRVHENWPNRPSFRFRLITKDRVAFFVNFDILRALCVGCNKRAG